MWLFFVISFLRYITHHSLQLAIRISEIWEIKKGLRSKHIFFKDAVFLYRSFLIIRYIRKYTLYIIKYQALLKKKKKKKPSEIPPVLRPNLSEHEPLNCFQNLLRLILLSGLRYSTKVNNILSEFVCLSKLEFYLFKSWLQIFIHCVW